MKLLNNINECVTKNVKFYSHRNFFLFTLNCIVHIKRNLTVTMAVGTKCRANSHSKSIPLQPPQGFATPTYRSPLTRFSKISCLIVAR